MSKESGCSLGHILNEQEVWKVHWLNFRFIFRAADSILWILMKKFGSVWVTVLQWADEIDFKLVSSRGLHHYMCMTTELHELKSHFICHFLCYHAHHMKRIRCCKYSFLHESTNTWTKKKHYPLFVIQPSLTRKVVHALANPCNGATLKHVRYLSLRWVE